MTSSLNLAFSRVIEDKRFLGLDESGAPIPDRFSFFVANKRGSDGRFYEKENSLGNLIPVYFHYMRDRATDDLYILHTVEQLPQYFLFAGAGAIPVTILTIAWNLARVVAIVVNAIFEVFQDIYSTRDIDVTKDLLDRLKIKETEKFEEIKTRLQWIYASLNFGLALEAAVLNALFNWKDEQTLFEMKVVVSRIEFLWNRKIDFHRSSLSQLNQFNKDMTARLEKNPNASRGEVALELFKQINWKDFFSISYIMQCFQSRGFIQDKENVVEEKDLYDELNMLKVGVERHVIERPKFEIVSGTEKGSYKEFAEFMDEQSSTWRMNV